MSSKRRYSLMKDDNVIRTELQVSGHNVIMSQQYVEIVSNVSSHLGSTKGICGFFDFDDIQYYSSTADSFVASTYGELLKAAPSQLEDFMPQNNDPIQAHDFVELEFSIEVYPVRISILERYEPGTVIRVWAWDSSTKYWQKLWSGPPQCCKDSSIEQNLRLFTPRLEVCKFKTCTIRLELNHSLTNYYTQFEGVLLFGTNELIVPKNSMINAIPQSFNCDKTSEETKSKSKNSDLHKVKFSECFPDSKLDLESMSNLSAQYRKNDTHNLTPYNPDENSIEYDIKNFMHVICKSHSIYARNLNDEEHPQDLSCDNDEIVNGRINQLSDEVLLMILGYLDLKTLVRCSQLNSRFKRIIRDFKLYRSLNLKPYWDCVNDSTLRYLQERCSRLTRLDLSWSCGTKISSKAVVDFLRNCGGKLTHLRLSNCSFVDNSVIYEISINCPHLKELCLEDCFPSTIGEFVSLANLKCLERLEFCNTCAYATELVKIIRSNVKLRHLNLGKFYRSTANLNWVIQVISESCPRIETLNLVEIGYLGEVFRGLSHCRNLRELNIGWYHSTNFEALAEVFRNCHNLEKVFATRVELEDEILEPLLHCRKMKLLDVANSAVSIGMVDRMFASWPDLRFIDLSCCFNRIDSSVICEALSRWSENYPNVSIIRNTRLLTF